MTPTRKTRNAVRKSATGRIAKPTRQPRLKATERKSPSKLTNAELLKRARLNRVPDSLWEEEF